MILVTGIATGLALLSYNLYSYSNYNDNDNLDENNKLEYQIIKDENNKLCTSCNKIRNKLCFSNRQFKKKHKARCIICINL